MVFERQNTGGTFVAWGKDNAKDGSYIVEEKKFLEAIVTDIKESDTYGRIFEVSCKDHDGPLIMTGTTMLLRETGFARDSETREVLPEGEQEVKRVVIGDKLRVHYDGMTKAAPGKKAAYNLWVEVDR